MSFFQQMEMENNMTTGWNGEGGHRSTLSANLDFHTRIGNMRYAQPEEIVGLFAEAFHEDERLALRNLFYSRDILKGMGEKRVFEEIVIAIAQNAPNVFSQMVPLIPEYGSFADLRKIIGSTNLDYEDVIPALDFLKEQIVKDYDSAYPSLCAKWMPTAERKNELHKVGVRRFCKRVGINKADYRKTISIIRKRLGIIETKMTEGRYEDIDYSKIPSQAFKKYTQAFYRNDEERFEAFLQRANEGAVKVNAGTLQAHQLVSKYLNSVLYQEDQAIEAQWKNLPKPDLETMPNVLTMVDVSGSMYGQPMEVAVSLGIYISENMQGEFKNKFLTFSENTELISFDTEKTLYDKVGTMSRASWGFNTNLARAFRLVLNTAVNNNLSQEEMPQVLMVLSDMQMDEASEEGRTFFEKMKRVYENHGYDMPFIVWWNISNDWDTAFPTTKFTKNAAMVSGFSQQVFSALFKMDLDELKNFTPEKAMLNILNSERYDKVDSIKL